MSGAIRIYCHGCRTSTVWVPTRGGRAERCSVCSTRFPCSHACGHLDCAEARTAAETRDTDPAPPPSSSSRAA